MTVKEIFESMDYGQAPESAEEALGEAQSAADRLLKAYR